MSDTIFRRRLARGLAALAVLAALALFGMAWARSGLVAPEPTLLLRDRHGRVLGDAGASPDGDRGWWPLAQLPQRVVAATLAAEDRRFWSHPGVDALAVGRALRQNIAEGRRVSGASTVPMQVARMQSPGARTLPRKALEAATAVVMVARHGREAVLAHYLRLAPYGQRTHGIACAARRYLDKPVEDLSWAEVAFLAALPQAPGRMDPLTTDGRERAVARARRILARLRATGVIGRDEFVGAGRELARLRIVRPRTRPAAALHAVLLLEERHGTPAARRARAHDPVVDTTLDLDLQEALALDVLLAADALEARGAGNAALVVLDRRTCDVLAWVGSTDWFDARRAGAIDYARTPRSPGSLLKPFLYGVALDRGALAPGEILDDLPEVTRDLENADRTWLGPLLPRQALGNSRNVPVATLLRRTGLDVAHAELAAMGLHDHSQPASRYGVGVAIGALPVTLERAVAAYAALASDGVLREPRWLLDAPAEPARRVLSESTARTLALWLSDPQARLPSFPRLGATELPFPVAVKTGTSSRIRDAWTVAFTQDYVVGAWIGRPDARPMKDLTGHRAAAPLVRRVIARLHGDAMDGLEARPFPPPRDAIATRLCALTGAAAGDACDRVALEWLPRTAEPPAPCAAHVRLAVDARDGRLATSLTPREHVRVQVFADLPPRLARWAAQAGLPRPPSAWASGPLATATGATGPVRIAVTSPPDGAELVRDPETPEALATIALAATVDPPTEQLVWYVDGAPWRLAEHPYAVRWPLQPGEHAFEARTPAGDRSRTVRVIVQ